jgi:ABC-type oligopeptide transport system ATPase subunit
MKLQQELNLSYLFITHDLSLMRNVSDRVAIMYLGKICEIAETKSFFERPLHPYTKALLSAVPVPDPNRRRSRLVLAPADAESHVPLREVSRGHWAAV